MNSWGFPRQPSGSSVSGTPRGPYLGRAGDPNSHFASLRQHWRAAHYVIITIVNIAMKSYGGVHAVVSSSRNNYGNAANEIIASDHIEGVGTDKQCVGTLCGDGAEEGSVKFNSRAGIELPKFVFNGVMLRECALVMAIND